MLLAVDIGNTNTVAGVFDRDVLVAQWRVATDRRRTPDEYAALASSLFRLSHIDAGNIDGAIIASVVPSALEAVRESARHYRGIEALVVSPSLDLGIQVRYQPSTAVGADRIANAVAAVERYGCPAIVVDFGTGTNFDVIDAGGVYIGGAIAPGLEISTHALFANTAQLPSVALVPPRSAIGNSTIASLQSGILFGYAGLVDGIVARIQRELGVHAHVIATGGLAGTVASLVESVEHVDLDLTLAGLRMIYVTNTA